MVFHFPRPTPDPKLGISIWTMGLEWNEEGEGPSGVEFILSTKIIHGNTVLEAFRPPMDLGPWDPLRPVPQPDRPHPPQLQVLLDRCLRYIEALREIGPRPSREVPLLATRREGREFRKGSPRTTINWNVYAFLAGLWEDSVMGNIDQAHCFVRHLLDRAKGAESLTTKRRLSPENSQLTR
ncbi:unnamed protein product [Heligmosomoides polygyrus]|uniref:UBC core domain-containing protein n=1 Tax=Heligmosomoides polygyrus TaxID=6339 RepID=A0A183GF07_HELPZ|nr:unnamed protein product [Heligmosomoides polygyrus]